MEGGGDGWVAFCHGQGSLKKNNRVIETRSTSPGLPAKGPLEPPAGPPRTQCRWRPPLPRTQGVGALMTTTAIGKAV